MSIYTFGPSKSDPDWLVLLWPRRTDIYSDQRVRPSVTEYFFGQVVGCVRFSSETTSLISPMLIPINWGNNVDVQRALHFVLDPSMTAGQGHKILRFCEFRCLTGSSFFSLLLQKYSTDFSNDYTNQLREQCRCTTYTSFWPLVRQGHKILRFCEFRCLTGSSLCSLLLRPYKVTGDWLSLVTIYYM